MKKYTVVVRVYGAGGEVWGENYVKTDSELNDFLREVLLVNGDGVYCVKEVVE